MSTFSERQQWYISTLTMGLSKKFFDSFRKPKKSKGVGASGSSEKSKSKQRGQGSSEAVEEKSGQEGIGEELAFSRQGREEMEAKEEKIFMMPKPERAETSPEFDGQAVGVETVNAAVLPTCEDPQASEVSSLAQSCNDMPELVSPTGSNHIRFSQETNQSSVGSCERQPRRRGCRPRKDNLSGIKVKYTKIFGESDGAYKNDSTPRGLVFMCNFSQFMNERYSQRRGSEVDYYSMLDLFQQLGYGGGRRDEKYCLTGHITKNRFMETLKEFSIDRRHRMLCSCVIIIMSHGSGPKTFVTSDDQHVNLMEIYTMFNNINCEILRGKPKIFILQFCRNESNLPSSRLRNTLIDFPLADRLRQMVREEIQKILEEQKEEQVEASQSAGGSEGRRYSEPAVAHELQDRRFLFGYEADTRLIEPQPMFEGVQKYSDMYSIFSTSSGELSHRDPHKGSLLIQAICHVFAENAYQDEIDTLVRKVSTYMNKTLQKDDPITVPRVTCERTNNGLDKKFFFNPEEVHYCRHVTI